MTTTAQLITYLQSLNPDTKIRVLKEVTKHYDTTTKWVDLVLPPGPDNVHFTDTCYLEFKDEYLYLGEN